MKTLGGTRIKVIGVGGGGSNAVNRMIDAGLHGRRVLCHEHRRAGAPRIARSPTRFALGTRITHGLGAGSDPEIGRQAALEDTDRIIEVLEGADMVFVTAGLGGGTGTGAAPVVAALAKELNALTVAVVTKPFSFEGPRRMKQAERGLAELHATVDTVISIPNDRLVELVPPGTSFFEAFRMADDVLRQGVQGISDIITTPGLINRDFADVRAIMLGMGFAMMGTATASGPNAAVRSRQRRHRVPAAGRRRPPRRPRHPAQHHRLGQARRCSEMYEACTLIREATDNEDVQINFGLVPDETLERRGEDHRHRHRLRAGRTCRWWSASAIRHRAPKHADRPTPRSGVPPRTVPAGVSLMRFARPPRRHQPIRRSSTCLSPRASSRVGGPVSAGGARLESSTSESETPDPAMPRS